MEDSRSYTPEELEAIKNPPKTLNSNSYGATTQKERVAMIISSKSFTVAASLFTLGFYYLYYLFCLEQEQDNPFFIGKEERRKDKYKYERPEEANPSYQEARRINQRMAHFASCQENKAPIKQRLCQSLKTIWAKTKLIVSVNVSNVIG